MRLKLQMEEDVGIMLHLFDGDQHVGKMGFSVCEVCRLGHVLKISVYEGHDQCGVAAELLRTLRATFPELTWYTSSQHPSAIGFWRLMATRSAHPYVERPRCSHPHRTARRLPEIVGPFVFAAV